MTNLGSARAVTPGSSTGGSSSNKNLKLVTTSRDKQQRASNPKRSE